MPPARVRALGLAIAASLMALFGIAGHSRISGPVILTFTTNHGVHLDDLLVFLCWLLSMGWCWRLWRESR